jgi:cob(I)alamin adenosyltransferase
MLYTKKGDDGTTKTFGCDQRMSKSSIIAEALGTLDETNSFLGFCKVKSKKENFNFTDKISFEKILHDIQKNLFIIQAEIAGAEKSITEDKVKEIENIVDSIEKEMPEIKTFFIAGGTKLAVLFDIARTVSRRAERRVIAVVDEGKIEVGEFTKAYLNRLSSLLYACARLANYRVGIIEDSPDYK